MSLPRPCIEPECTSLAFGGPRCTGHGRQYQRARNADPKRQAYNDPAYKSFVRTVCAACGSTEDLTRDHIVPLALGGTNDPANLQCLCRSCNARKHSRSDGTILRRNYHADPESFEPWEEL